MWDRFVENLPWILILVALAGILALIVYRLVRAKKRGTSTCGCGCQNCAMKDVCHAPKTKKQAQNDT